MKTPRSGSVPSFWKLITQASFHGRGPPPKSFMMWLLTRPMAAAQAGALAGMGAEAVAIDMFASPVFSSVPLRGEKLWMSPTAAVSFLCSGSQNSLTPAADSLSSPVFSSRFVMMFSFRFQRGEDGKMRSLKLMLSPQNLCGAFADNDAGSHGVAGRHARHDRSIGNTQVFDSIDLEVGVYDQHGVTPHFGGTRLMPVGTSCIANECFKCRPFQIGRHHLALGERAKRSRVAYLAAKFHTDDRGSKIVWMGQRIFLDLD